MKQALSPLPQEQWDGGGLSLARQCPPNVGALLFALTFPVLLLIDARYFARAPLQLRYGLISEIAHSVRKAAAEYFQRLYEASNPDVRTEFSWHIRRRCENAIANLAGCILIPRVGRHVPKARSSHLPGNALPRDARQH